MTAYDSDYGLASLLLGLIFFALIEILYWIIIIVNIQLNITWSMILSPCEHVCIFIACLITGLSLGFTYKMLNTYW